MSNYEIHILHLCVSESSCVYLDWWCILLLGEFILPQCLLY